MSDHIVVTVLTSTARHIAAEEKMADNFPAGGRAIPVEIFQSFNAVD
jgi:hypothetical protein